MPNLTRAILATMLFAAVAMCRGATDDLIDRVRKLEDRITALEGENAALKKQAAARPDAGLPVVPQGKESKLALGGFMQIHGEAGDAPDSRFPANDRFLMRRARIGLKGSFAENFDFVLQTDLGNNSLNSTSGFRAQLTDGFVVWNKYSFANVTVGQFKVPYGYEQLLADAKILTVERSLPNDQMTLPRQVGAMVSGAFLEKRLTYAAAIGNGNGATSSFNDNEQFDYIGRIAGTLVQQRTFKVMLGVNAYTGYDTGSFSGHRTGRGIDAELFAGALEIDAELLRTHFDRDTGADFDAQGWAVTASYMLVPNAWRAVARYESYDPNRTIGSDATSERTIGIDYFIKGDDLRLSLNYVIGNPPGAPKHQDRILSRMQIIF